MSSTTRELNCRRNNVKIAKTNMSKKDNSNARSMAPHKKDQSLPDTRGFLRGYEKSLQAFKPDLFIADSVMKNAIDCKRPLVAPEQRIDPVFVADSLRLREKKRQFGYEGEDTPVQDAKVNFKVNFYFTVLDVTINFVLERFQQLQQMKSVFGFLYDVKSLTGKTNTQLMENCTKLETALRDGESKDIDTTDLCHELQAVAHRLQPDTVTPLDVLKFICEQGLVHSVPNTFVALRILLTFPVTVASGEKSLSKLKLIKTYVRSTMTVERLVGLAMVFIENEIAQKVDLRNLVADFAKQKARKAYF
ncbi:zinc finger MYM-type protein 1-like [Palaemon carinicauda]|uniref:zinc finger MYM-type protein 1-like n=1 Tax=Palaemon carinicauda TaxID=392227 RepID=UPI0035B6493A